jgi:hypothetical protein
MQCHWKGSYIKQPLNDFKKVEWVLGFSGWPGTTMSGEIGYPPKPRTFGSPEHDPAENKPLNRGPRRAARFVSPRSLPMRLPLQSAQFLLRRCREAKVFVCYFGSTFRRECQTVEKVAEISCVTNKRIRKILTLFSSDFLDWGLL